MPGAPRRYEGDELLVEFVEDIHGKRGLCISQLIWEKVVHREDLLGRQTPPILLEEDFEFRIGISGKLLAGKEAFFEKNFNIGVAIHVKKTRFMEAPDIKITVISFELLWSYSIPAL